MSASELRVLSVGPGPLFNSAGSTAMTGVDFDACFLADFDITSQFPLEAVIAEAPGDFPTYIRGDPGDRVIPLHIRFGSITTQALIDELKSIFSPFNDEFFLFVQDDDGNNRRMLMRSLGLVPWETHSERAYVASLEAVEPIWENEIETTDSEAVSAPSPHSWAVVNNGNERVYPQIDISPGAVKGNGNDFIRKWPITIAWRSSLDGVDSQGLPYPIDIVDRSFDTATEIAAARMQADGDDIRVYVDGVAVDRYLDDINTASTAVWCSIAFQPSRQATLAATITAGAPANGGQLDADNPEGTTAFPEEGILLIGSEAITYSGKTPTAFLDIRRARRGTTAAGHTAADVIYWVEHDIQIVTNFTVATNPMAAADLEPIIDKTVSTNLRHHYTTAAGFIEPNTLRSGQWLRDLRGSGAPAAASRLSQSAGVITVEDAFPQGGAPNFDSLSLYTPCFVSTLITGVDFDYEVDHDMLLEVNGVDSEGFEALLLRRDVRGEATTDDRYVGAPVFNNNVALTPPALLSRLTLQGRNYRVTGDVDPTEDFVVGGSADQEAEEFNLTALTVLIAISTIINKNAGSDRALSVRLESLDATTGPTGILFMDAVLIPTGEIPTSPTTERATIFATVAQVSLAPGAFALVAREVGGTVGEVRVFGQNTHGFYAGGSRWSESASVWTESPGGDISCVALSYVTGAQADAAVALGTTVRWRNVAIDLSPNFTPTIVIGSASDVYLMTGVLENVTTGQTVTVTYPVGPISSLNTELQIFTAIHRLIYRQRLGGVDSHELDIPGALEPADLQEWLYLQPGSNTLRWTEANIGAGSLNIATIFRDRWS